jgi:formylglycine-generating enzyme required for sulfatase activity
MKLKNQFVPFLILVLLVLLSACGRESMPAAAPSATLPPPTPSPEPTQAPERFDTRTRISDGMVMVYVPAGQFEMGSNEDQRAKPVHSVALDAFWIDQSEVTNAMFAAFLNERGNQVEEGVSWLEPGAGHRGIIYGHIEEHEGVFRPESGYEDYPVIEVSWYGAAAYCEWVGARLPSEAEWEYAARGPQALAYPWGNTFDGSLANYCDANCTYDWRDMDFDDGYAQWAPVGSYTQGASWCNALDMAGNVWEWVNDWWSEDYYAHSPMDNPQGPDSGTLHVARGGSWFDEGSLAPLSRRAGLTPSSYRMHWVGLRCVEPARSEAALSLGS